jgi:hypothetical protein
MAVIALERTRYAAHYLGTGKIRTELVRIACDDSLASEP